MSRTLVDLTATLAATRLEVDFAYDDLVIEIDGPGHDRPRTRREDAARDARLREAGYEVIRIRA